ncbi:hypothetical protein SMD44_07361 [Streptomyces alboflavus]|uniref:Uncharacterized protein n=1 Tax=Streptomyces alboflavus TaxID=67267 RepID=A0A1Z1WNB4_9ACTN|nr:hypothetical protein [Streptomyces alboflavus]ARX87879.1 hypothetical protein SMD44_07361 [Streptomyces alboflavus]
MWLADGQHIIGCAELVCGRAEQSAAEATAIADVEPWARTIAHLDRAGRIGNTLKGLARVLERSGYVVVHDEETGEPALRQDRRAWNEEIRRRFAGQADPQALEGEDLGRTIRLRLQQERADASQAATDALPARLPLPALPGGWDAWQPTAMIFQPGPPRTWAELIAPLLLARWMAAPDPAARDDVIRWAAEHLGADEVHRAIGGDRSTIDRALEVA